jgi:transcriptional regulator with XRE-family HTH domain
MTVMTEERPDQAAAPVRRPASGISIDPGRLIWWREDRIWSRQDLSDAVARLNLSDEGGEPLTVTRDAIAKIENGERKPKARTVRALCAALGITVRDLMPGDEPLTPHADAEERKLRLEHNKDLRRFARVHGIQYRNPVSGRVYYSVPLQAAYEAAVSDADDKTVAALVAAARSDPADPGAGDLAGQPVSAQDGIEELDLTVRTHNGLIRHGIRTVGDLTAFDPDRIRGFKGFGAASVAEIRERLGAAGFTLHGEGASRPDPELLAS